MKKTFIGLIVFLLVLGMVFAAKPNFVTATNTKANVPVIIPANAVQVADNVFSLGTAVDVDGRIVEGYAIIHKKDGNAKPPWVGGGSGGTNCYGFLANGAKWKTIEPYMVNSANTKGLNATFVASNLAMDIGKWETAANFDILGVGSSTTETLVADTASPDNKNEVYFADIADSGAIAVTIVWGHFSGPPSWRELVEWDQVYDDVDFDWSATGELNKMDFNNIATHELGHSVGLGDLYTSECSQETMYGYASNGETNKQSLEAGDIAGIRKLYS